MPFVSLPATAAWQHRDARSGFEVVFFQLLDDGYRIEGCTIAVEDGATWIVGYEIVLDARWTTRSARISGRSASGSRSVALEADGAGSWRVDGTRAPHQGYDYTAPVFDFACQLVYDESGLLLDYPGIAVRAG